MKPTTQKSDFRTDSIVNLTYMYTTTIQNLQLFTGYRKICGIFMCGIKQQENNLRESCKRIEYFDILNIF